MPIYPDLSNLLNLFKIIGKSVPMHTQGQGSNLSIKDTKTQTLLIKPSGLRLDEINSRGDLVEINLIKLAAGIEEIKSKSPSTQEVEYAELLKKVQTTESQLRPSMESGFHALLPKKFVLHFHSLVAMIMASFWEAQSPEFNRWLEGQKDIEFCKYQTPGFNLSCEIKGHLKHSFIVLARHGVICQSDDDQIFDRWVTIETSFLQSFPQAKTCLLEVDITKVPGKLVFFYPDIAVFATQLLSCLKEESPGTYLWQGNPDLPSKEQRNLSEIWQANLRLNSTGIFLGEIPEQDIHNISMLPTELIRQRDRK